MKTISSTRNLLFKVVGLLSSVFLLSSCAKESAPPPPSLTLPVPFSSQAPTNNWHKNEDCEETSIVMANAYLTHNDQEVLPAAAAQEAINVLKKWEQANIGHNADTGADETTHMAQEAFGLQVRQIPDFTAQDLKNELANQHVILLPLNAGILNNPNYRQQASFYHMIVIRGYGEKGFIVNDPGTSTGKSDVYSFDTLKRAAADWNNKAKVMEPSRKIALVVWK